MWCTGPVRRRRAQGAPLGHLSPTPEPMWRLVRRRRIHCGGTTMERGGQAGGVIVRVAFGVLATLFALARLVAVPNCHASRISFAPYGCSHNRARACTSMSDLSRMRDAAGRRLFGRGVIPRRNTARRLADDRIAPAEMIGGIIPKIRSCEVLSWPGGGRFVGLASTGMPWSSELVSIDPTSDALIPTAPTRRGGRWSSW